MLTSLRTRCFETLHLKEKVLAISFYSYSHNIFHFQKTAIVISLQKEYLWGGGSILESAYLSVRNNGNFVSQIPPTVLLRLY